MEPNNSHMVWNNTQSAHLDNLIALIPTTIVGLIIGLLNITTICIIMLTKRLRRPANLPMVSILVAAALQGILTTPAYIYKRKFSSPSYPGI